MIRLELAGPDTRLLSALCSRCPHCAAGCCVSPSEMDWSDIGRIVARGGREWLLTEIARKNLVPAPRGLALRRARGRTSSAAPRLNKCVYHGPGGCTIGPERRPATCNYYLCEAAYTEGGEAKGDVDARSARRAHGELSRLYEGWDREIAAGVAARWPDGPAWDGELLDWLGAEFSARSG